MNEFEWRRQLRELRDDVEPPAQVWTAIASRIEASHSQDVSRSDSRRSRQAFAWTRPALALAATLVVAIGVAMMFALSPASLPRESVAGADVTHGEKMANATTSPALDERQAGLARNPVLAATDAELREVQEQLQRALALQPDSESLQRMLSRTASERRRLLQYQAQFS